MRKILLYIINKLNFLIPESIVIPYSEKIFDKKDNSLLNLFARNYFKQRYKNASQEGKKRLGLLIWRSKTALNYFKNRVYDKLIIDRFNKIIQQNSEFDICEIGTGDGNLIMELSKHSQNRHFVGIDLNSEQININKKNFKNIPGVDFVCADILEYIQKDNNKPTLYISHVSLTTFTPEMVTELFKFIAKRNAPSILAIYEPIESKKPDGDQSAERDGLAYAHNYITIAKKLELTIIEKISVSPFLWFVCRK